MRRLLRTIVLFAAGVFAGGRVRQSRRRAAVPEDAARAGATKRRLVPIAVFLGSLALLGAFLVLSGIIPLKASSGHWAVTRGFLNFAMRRSVVTHSIGIEAPPLDDPALVLRGAGHYETACRPCHGAPGFRRPVIAQEMTPHPPYLPPVIPQWTPEQLFYIVKYGVKFTGMPAWPALEREDEVWSVVAFLRALPEMSPEAYRRLARNEAGEAPGAEAPVYGLLGPEEVPAAVETSCARCHGADGLGRGVGAFPRLAGQRPAYLFAALRAYARGERNSGIMEPIAAGLSVDEMRALARYYSRLEVPVPPPAALPAEVRASIARGEAIAHRGLAGEGVPSCADCHGPGDLLRNPFYPDLAGQYANYLVSQLELFKQEARGGSVYAHLMHPTADRLTPEQMRDVAQYYASLAAAR